MKKTLLAIGAAAALSGGLLFIHSQQTPPQKVGPLPDGGFLLNSGWAIRPAGTQVDVDTFPMNAVASSNGKYLVVLNGGYNPPSLSVIATDGKTEVARVPVTDAWQGLAITRDDTVYAGGGTSGYVFEFGLNPDSGALTEKRRLAALPTGTAAKKHLLGSVTVTPDAHILYVADVSGDSIGVINLRSGTLTDTWHCGRRPYQVVIAPGGSQIFVSSWADGSVYQYDATTGKQIAQTRVGQHPTGMLLVPGVPPSEGEEPSTYTARLFVAASNTNNVYSLGLTKDLQLNMLESINVSMTPLHPLGMTPSALAINKDGTELYVVCSDANAVAVANISTPRASVAGFIPTAWYPTAVTALANDSLAIVNGKGRGSRPNPDGPVPGQHKPGYIPAIQKGTVSLVDAPDADAIRKYTQIVLNNSPYRDEVMTQPVSTEAEAFFAAQPGHPSPIKHVIYIIKENRTYDQVFGDMDRGNGDKSLTLFGEQITPNAHELAREYILYDNFYENADVSAEGHNWANAAIAPDYTVKTWPSNYANRKPDYDYEGGEAANIPPAGYIWDNALQAGLTVRDYGEWTENVNPAPANGGVQIEKILDPALRGHVDMNYRGWDLTYQDVDRAHEFIREWNGFSESNSAPALSIVRLGNNHTEGLKPGALTPSAHVADNDHALGLLVDAVSHSKLWSSTAIFVIEDDAQNGPDHVDSHRAPALVISPYTRRGIVDSAMYNQTGLLRTIELVLGLRPMTHFDAGATPMFETFTRQPDTKPYTAVAPRVSVTERNPATGPWAEESRRMDFSEPDRVEDNELTAVLWKAMKSGDAPPATRSRFAK